MKKSENIKEVFKRYLSNQHTVEDFKLIQSYFAVNDEGELFDLIQNELAKDSPALDSDTINSIISKTDSHIKTLLIQEQQERTPISIGISKRIKIISLAAAVLLCILSVSLYFTFTKRDASITDRHLAEQTILPGGNRATLDLGNGRIISLDSIDSGVITEETGLLLTKDEEGVITYRINESDYTTSNPISFNTLRTPVGGQYKIILQDGTKVWLNAASSIRYPNRFDDHERRVELIGEAYFEVTENRNKPFIVVSNGQEVKVLGTEFNINTSDYLGKSLTTLIKGSIEISNEHHNLLLVPGQQASVKNKKISVRDKVDTRQITAWKKGEFYFDGAKIEEIIEQLKNWYDIDVEYNGSIDHSFVLKISRYVPLQEILSILEMTDLVHFEFEENKLLVTP